MELGPPPTWRPGSKAEMMMRFGFASKKTAMGVLGAIGVAAACTRTPDPLEYYASPAAAGGMAMAGTAAGGKPAQGGSETTGGGTSPATGGSSPAEGGSDNGVGGQGGDGNMVPEPPDDLGCGDAPVTSVEKFSKRALRAAAADCARWHYCRFEAGARQLSDELNEYVAAPTPDSLARAREAYAAAFALASVNELFQFGPFASASESQGKDTHQGKGLRESIYSWPNSARCRVEEQLATRGYAKTFNGVLVSARGLFALDYLLHYPGSDTACAATSATGMTWSTLGEDEIAAAKAEYAAALGEDVLQRAQAVTQAWAPEVGNFAPVLVDASGYPTELEAMKVVAWSLLYVERDVKDWKLGLPAGYTDPEKAPVSVAEAVYSGLKIEAIRQNLRGFRGLYQGCGPDGEGVGFDDWLTDARHPELASEIVDAYVAAQTVADASPPLDEASPNQLEQLYVAVKRLTDLLKNDLFGAGSPIGLTLPPGLEGDTD